MKIAVVGTGYVGLVTGTCFAETGNNVTCVDIDKKRLISSMQAVLPFMNPVSKIIYPQSKRGQASFYYLT